MKIFNKTYDNGLRLILQQNEKDVVALNILFGVGSNYEREDEEGFSHFIEHLVFKSSENFTTGEIMEKLTALGADFNAYTSKNLTRFIFKCLSQNFEKCFEIYSDMLISPLFNKEEMDSERNVVIEEMKKYEDEPVEVMLERVSNNYFSGTSFAHDVLGSEDIIASVDREKLLEYKNRFYTSDNCVISVAGNIDFDTLDGIVTKYFASKFNFKAKPRQVDFSEVVPNVLKKYDIVERNDSQVNICLHIKSVSYKSKDKYVADLYSVLLGGPSNSRLYKKVREELGLVYTIYSYPEIEARNGEIYIVLGTRLKNVKRAVLEIRNIIDEIAKVGVSESEFEICKNWKKSYIEFASETNSDTAEINGSLIYYNQAYISLESRRQKYDSIKLSEINDFAKRIANESCFNVVAVGKNIKLEDLQNF